MSTKESLSRVSENLSVRRSFGTPYEKDGLLIIPVALVAGGGGVGEGPMMKGHDHGPSGALRENDLGDSDESETDSPEGSGAGFGGVTVPMGVYVVQGDDVCWKPAVNVTLIVMASLGVLRLLLRLVARVYLRRSTRV